MFLVLHAEKLFLVLGIIKDKYSEQQFISINGVRVCMTRGIEMNCWGIDPLPSCFYSKHFFLESEILF